MNDVDKWLEWLKDDPLTALTCYEGAGLDWTKAWKEYGKRFLPKSKNQEDLDSFDAMYKSEVEDYGFYNIDIIDNMGICIDYYHNEVLLIKKDKDGDYHDAGILLTFERPRGYYSYDLVEICLREIEPYVYHLLFPMTVQTTEDEQT